MSGSAMQMMAPLALAACVSALCVAVVAAQAAQPVGEAVVTPDGTAAGNTQPQPHPGTYTESSVDELHFNRKATALTRAQLEPLNGAHRGFIWNGRDNNTPKWRPQGIAGIVTGPKKRRKKFLAVSWYGRKQAPLPDEEKGTYARLGVRVSFVDVTPMRTTIKYRHVLLVDQQANTFEGMHAGGLAHKARKLYVPDSRSTPWKIHVFNTARIKRVPSDERHFFHNYGYILVLESSYNIGVKPSFLSFDWSQSKFLVGAFNRRAARSLYWYDRDADGDFNVAESAGPFYAKMQGAASDEGHLWISTSFGGRNASTLYYGKHAPNTEPDLDKFSSKTYPPGLEDIHNSLTSDNIWLLTEFSPTEPKNGGNNRMVFATRKSAVVFPPEE